MKVGILGGTGRFGSALAGRIAHTGLDVVVGSRNSASAQKAAAKLNERWGTTAIIGGTLRDAADTDLVVASLPPEDVVKVVHGLRDVLIGKTIVSPVNRVKIVNGDRVPNRLAGTSVSEELQAVVPQSHVVTAFNHIPANATADPAATLRADIFVCANDTRAHENVCELIKRIEGLHPLVVGGLVTSGAVEAFTSVLINVNVREGRQAAVCLTAQGART